METEKVDIMEVVLKHDLQIPLTKQEEVMIGTIDEESIAMIKALINDRSYKEEILKLYKKILIRIQLTDILDRDFFIAKCQDRITNIENPINIDDNIAKIYK